MSIKFAIKKFLNIPHKKTPREIMSFCFNLFLVLLSVLGIVFLFVIPIERSIGKIETADWTTFKFFTTDSNILVMIAAIIYLIYIILIWSNKIEKLPLWAFCFKHTATLTVGLTMFVTLFVLLPGSILTKSYPTASLYMGSNLFFHLINPLVAVISFLLFENKKDIKFKHTFWSLIPVVIYCIFYLCVAYTHTNPDGSIPMEYDWYKFCSFGIPAAVGICIALFGIYYLFAWLLWLGNRKINIKSLNR